MAHSDAPRIIPSQLLSSCISFGPSLCGQGGQQDAHEFLHLILEVFERVVLHPEPGRCTVLTTPTLAPQSFPMCRCPPLSGDVAPCSCTAGDGLARPATLAAYTFGGILQSDITCECGNLSARLEPFTDLSVDVGTHVVGSEMFTRHRRADAVDGVPCLYRPPLIWYPVAFADPDPHCWSAELMASQVSTRATSVDLASAASGGAAEDAVALAAELLDACETPASPEARPALDQTPPQSPSLLWASDGEREATLFLTPDGTLEISGDGPQATKTDRASDDASVQSAERAAPEELADTAAAGSTLPTRALLAANCVYVAPAVCTHAT